MQTVLIAALSLDGRLTRPATPGATFASAEDQAFLKARLAESDATVMGAETYRLHREAIRTHQPTGRRRLVWTRRPTEFASETIPGSLEFTDVSPEATLNALRDAGCKRCVLLGGMHVYTAFLSANLVDELWLTYEPELTGTGLPLATEPLGLRWTRIETLALTPDTFAVHYRRTPSPSLPVSPVRPKSNRASLIAFFFTWVAVQIAIGAALGAFLFPIFGPLFGAKMKSLELIRAGARFGSFYFMIWAPGAALVATFMCAHKKAGPPKATPRS